MGKRKNMNDFDKRHTVMARRLGQSISKTQGHGHSDACTQWKLGCLVQIYKSAAVEQIAKQYDASLLRLRLRSQISGQSGHVDSCPLIESMLWWVAQVGPTQYRQIIYMLWLISASQG